MNCSTTWLKYFENIGIARPTYLGGGKWENIHRRKTSPDGMEEYALAEMIK